MTDQDRQLTAEEDRELVTNIHQLVELYGPEKAQQMILSLISRLTKLAREAEQGQ